MRLVPMLMLGGLYHFLGQNLFVFHLLSILMTWGVALLLVMLLRCEQVSLLIASVLGFAALAHPVVAENAAEIIHIPLLTGLFFLLLALYLYASYRDRHKPVGLYFLEGALIFLMLFSYEQYVVAPALLFCYEFFIKARGRWSRVTTARFIPSFSLWTFLLLFYLLVRLLIFRGIGGYHDYAHSNLLVVLPQTAKWVAGFCFAGLIPGEIKSLTQIILTVLFLLGFLRRRNQWPLWIFVLGWFLISILPFMIINPTGHHLFELTVVGVLLGLGLIWNENIKGRSKTGLRLFSLIAGLGILVFWELDNQRYVTMIAQRRAAPHEIAQSVIQKLDRTATTVQLYWAADILNKQLPVYLDILAWPVSLTESFYSLDSTDFASLVAPPETTQAGSRRLFILSRAEQLQFYPDFASWRQQCQNHIAKVK